MLTRAARALAGLGLAAGSLALGGCVQRSPPPRVMLLVRIHNDPDGVFLNETLVFQFSERLNPSSVNAASVAITDEAGRPARGEYEVFDRRLHFVPAPVRSPDLQDGGLRPSTRYRVELAGFPQLAGLYAASGAPLERSVVFEFETVDPAEPRTGYVFEDATPASAEPIALAPESFELGPDEPIVFEGLEPIDPQSIDAGAFRLRRELDGPSTTVDGEPNDDRFGPPIECEAYLVDNRPPDPATGARRTLLHLRPFEELEPGRYELHAPFARLGLTDFSGNTVTITGLPVTQTFRLEVSPVVGPTGSYREDFLDSALKSGEVVEGAAGTALWGPDGRCTIAYPRAAGDGSDGDVVLAGVTAVTDLQAIRLVVPGGELGTGAIATIDAGLETVVLRAQGDIVIAGRLTRTLAGGGEPLEFGLPLGGTGAAEDAAAGPVQLPATLSEWLAAARTQQRGWTVIIAGGDLSITGSLRIPGGALLVAGGRVRVSGSIEQIRGEPDLDPYRLDARSTVGPDPNFQDAGSYLVVDPPLLNVLKRPLTYAVLSGPLPRRGRAQRWERAAVGGRAGAGAWRVRFLDAAHGGVRVGDERAVDQPALLAAAPSVRFLVELELPAGPGPGEPPIAWDPPSVDFVSLAWHPTESRE